MSNIKVILDARELQGQLMPSGLELGSGRYLASVFSHHQYEASLQPKMQSTFVPSTPETNVSDDQIFTFVKEINQALLNKNNSLWTLPNDQKVDIGINVCNALRKGYTNPQIADFYFNKLKKIQVSRYEGALARDYIATIVVRAPQYFCPEYSKF